MDTEMQEEKLYGSIAKHLGKLFHKLARQRDSKMAEGRLCPDPIHMLIEISPKHSVSGVVGYIKGKSAIAIARTYLGKRQNVTGQNFWTRRYYVSIVGKDEQAIRKHIQEQEAEDKWQGINWNHSKIANNNNRL
jgi:putative transposase